MAKHHAPNHAAPSRTAFVLLLTALLAGVALTGLAIMRSVSIALAPPQPTPQIAGITAITPPEPLPDFTLTGTDGQPIRLSSLNGRYVLLFFGYTHCPDFCPLTLATMRQVKDALGAAAQDFAFVFVSVDGARDTPALLGDYLARFDAEFIGMTGDEAAVRALGVPYSLSFTLNKEDANDTNYLVDHTTLTYVIDPQQRLYALISYNTNAGVVADYLRTLSELG
jgi:protein SCO1/2